MYLKLPGYQKLILKDVYTVYIPPVPAREKIAGWQLKKSDQFWKRTPLPSWYEERREEEREIQEKEKELVDEGVLKRITHYDPTLERYRREEWNRRIHGHWFMNNGKPVYLSPHHYMYLQWSKLDHPENDGYPLFYMHQVERFYFRQLCEEDPFSLGYIIIGPRGPGKCLAKGTKVRLYHGGLKNAEDVVVGDLLMGPDSKPRKVLKCHSGFDDLYEIVQNKAMNYTVNSQHVLSLKRNSGASFSKKDNKNIYPEFGTIANIPIGQLRNRSKNFLNTFSGYKVGVEYQEKPISIDPYFLGVWLGDGNSDYPIITSMDPEIVTFLTNYAKQLGLILKKRGNSVSKASLYTFVSTAYRSAKNKLLDLLRKENLINNKHIPFNYLYNSRKNRLQLLAGLLDTDGHMSDNFYEITQVRKDLAFQIKLLADTLGYKTVLTEKIINKTIYYRLTIGGHNDEIPVKIERKKTKVNPNKDPSLTKIKEIRYVGKGEYFGFEIDGDHLFLLEDGTVTHNSSEEVACQLDNMTKPPHNRHAAIQSKTGDDAKDVVFKEKMVLMFNSYPDFFKPEYNHGSDPVEGMFFKRESKKGKDSKKVKYGPEFELGNTIKHYSAKEKALDGKTVSDVIHDEVGKTHPKKEADVNKRLSVVVKSVFRNQKKRGIIRATTTVEEMKEGGNECYEIWKNSDPKYRDGNGYTVSKLYKWFINAAECRSDIATKYGEIDEEVGRQLVLNERIPIQHDLIELSRTIRKNPLDEEEAFLRDQATSPFDVFILATRKQELSGLRTIGRQGKLEWKTEKDGEVVWVDDAAGYFTRFINIDETRSTRKILNASRVEYNEEGKAIWLPVNDDLATGGLDPIRWTQTADSRASKLAAYGLWRYDPLMDNGKDVKEWTSHNIQWKYHGRSKDPTDDYENIIKAMRFFGHRIMPEGNLSEFTKHAYDRGYWNYLIIRKDFDKTVLAGKSKNPMTAENPVSTQKEVTDAFVTRIIQFVNVHGRRMWDVPLIKQLQDFDPDNKTFFDLVIAFGYALIALEHRINPNFQVTDTSPKNIETFFQTYDISGDRSKPIFTGSEGMEKDSLIHSIERMIKNTNG